MGDYIRPGLLQPGADEMRIGKDHVFGFIWDGREGWLGEQLIQMVNNDIQECTAMDMPIALQYFSTPQDTIRHDLDFENQLYDLLGDLVDCLIEL